MLLPWSNEEEETHVVMPSVKLTLTSTVVREVLISLRFIRGGYVELDRISYAYGETHERTRHCLARDDRYQDYPKACKGHTNR